MNIAKLPWISIESEREAPSVLMSLGGRAPEPSWLSALDFRGAVWAVDGGVDACRAADVAPRFIIGDRDSASAEGWRWAISRGATERRFDAEKT